MREKSNMFIGFVCLYFVVDSIFMFVVRFSSSFVFGWEGGGGARGGCLRVTTSFSFLLFCYRSLMSFLFLWWWAKGGGEFMKIV